MSTATDQRHKRVRLRLGQILTIGDLTVQVAQIGERSVRLDVVAPVEQAIRWNDPPQIRRP